MFENTNPIERTAEMLAYAKDYAEEYLEGNPSVLLMVASTLTQLINKLNFMTGRQTVSTPHVEHPPITEFMGEKITYANKINKADLTPAEADRSRFIEKVESLYAQFDSITPQGLLNSFTLPEDQLVIRGVAKRAGVEGYEDRGIDEDFIEDIAIAIKVKAADDAQQAEIDRQLEQNLQTNQTNQQQAQESSALNEEKEEDDDEEEEDEDNEEGGGDVIPPAEEDANKTPDDAQQAEGKTDASKTETQSEPPAGRRGRRNTNNTN
jgi:hypothetical protein